MEQVQSADGTTIAFDRSGSGPALVLVVGAFNDRSSTRSLAAGLGASFTVYAYDRRGRGDSGDGDSYSIEREVEDLYAVIEATAGSAAVFGHSSGAALALEAAGRGVPLRRLVVYEPPYTEGPNDAFAARLERLVAAGRRAEAVEAYLTLLGTPPAAIEQMRAGPYWGHLTTLAHTLPYDIRLCNNGSLPVDRLARIMAPTLALAGGDSPAWARQGAFTIAETVALGQARVLAGQGHGVADEVLIPLLREFLLGARA